nr:DNA helicase [Tanacetum cinerariifolium]
MKLQDKAIVCPKNDTTDIINNKIMSLLPGRAYTYLSYDEAIPHGHERGEVELLYRKEYLNTLSFPGLPLHRLELKIGTPIMLLRNIAIAEARKELEDDVAKISTSIYVTNFPESISAKELFNSCKVYGHVVDSFIPNKRAKNDTNYKPIFLDFRELWVMDLSMRLNRMAVKGDESKREMKAMSQPAMVLDDECLITKDLSNSLMGRVKVFASLANLKMTLNNEGFLDVKIQYLGEFWVLLEFASKETLKKF